MNDTLSVDIIAAHNGHISQLKWSHNGRFLASCGDDKLIRIWDNAGKMVREFDGHVKTVTCLAWSPDDTRIAAGSADEAISIWDIKKDRLNWKFARHYATILDLIWLANDTILSYDERCVVYNWHPDTGIPIYNIRTHQERATHLALSPDADLFATAGGDHTIRIWNTEGYSNAMLKGHQDGVSNLIWSPSDKDLLISASVDGTIRVWNMQTKKTTNILEGHEGAVRSISLDARHGILASAGVDGSIRLWSTETWQMIGRLGEDHSGNHWRPIIDLHPNDGRLAALGTKPGEIIIRKILWDKNYTYNTEDSIRYIAAKIVLVGESGVGKTGLGWRLSHDEFKEHASTHGQQCWLLDKLKFTREDNTECEAVLWDLAGQKDYRLIHGLFLDDVDLGLIVINPADTTNPLKGVHFWQNLLKHKFQEKLHSILIGARNDRGPSSYTQTALAEFCQQNDISGGYHPTSAYTGHGIGDLIEKLKSEIAWNEKMVTTTTRTFKVVKEYIQSIKEKTGIEQQNILLTLSELEIKLDEYNQTVLKPAGKEIRFTSENIEIAANHLSKHGHIRILQNAQGHSLILLTPELLQNVASSIIIEARDNVEGLGAVDEALLRSNQYSLGDLNQLAPEEKKTLIDSVILLFISKNIAFRERIGKSVLLIFPELINLKKPASKDGTRFFDGRSYNIKGSIDNLYGAMVVLLGYTNILTRKEQWQDQALYEFEKNASCGFRQQSLTDGELEFVLFYAEDTSERTQQVFQGIFEKFLEDRDITIVVTDPVICPKCRYRISREDVKLAAVEKRHFIFCAKDGVRIPLTIPLSASAVPAVPATTYTIDGEERMAKRKTHFEKALSGLLSTMPATNIPQLPQTCFISYAWGDTTIEQWVRERLAPDLNVQGVEIILDIWENKIGANLNKYIERIPTADYIIVVGTPDYLKKYNGGDTDIMPKLAAEMDLINTRLNGTKKQQDSVFPIIKEGDEKTALPPRLQSKVLMTFYSDEDYYLGIFDILCAIFDARLSNPEITRLRSELKKSLTIA